GVLYRAERLVAQPPGQRDDHEPGQPVAVRRHAGDGQRVEYPRPPGELVRQVAGGDRVQRGGDVLLRGGDVPGGGGHVRRDDLRVRFVLRQVEEAGAEHLVALALGGDLDLDRQAGRRVGPDVDPADRGVRVAGHQ